MVDLNKLTDAQLDALISEKQKMGSSQSNALDSLDNKQLNDLIAQKKNEEAGALERGSAVALKGLAKGATSMFGLGQTLGDKVLTNMIGGEQNRQMLDAYIGQEYPRLASYIKTMTTPIPEQIERATPQIQPINAVERFVNTGAEMLGAGATINQGMNVANTANTLLKPTLGATAGVQTAREANLGETAELVLGLAGGFAGARSSNAPKMSKAEKFLSKYITPDEAKQSLARAKELIDLGIKAPQAMTNPSEAVYNLAATRMQSVATAKQASKGFNAFVKDLTNSEAQFVKGLVKDARTLQDDALAFKAGATSIKNGIVDTIRSKSTPLYDNIKGKVIPSKVIEKLKAENPLIANEINKVATDPVNQQLLKGAKENTIDYLDRVKRILGGKVDPDKSIMMAYTQAKKNLVDELDKIVPEYKVARNAFADESDVLASFMGDGKKPFMEKIINFANEDAVKSVKNIFNLQPQDISRVRQQFIKYGHKDAFNAATRAYIDDVITNKVSETTLSQYFGKPAIRSKINAALGSPDKQKVFDQLIKVGDDLKKAQGLRPRAGSPTKALLEAEEAFRKGGQNAGQKALEGIGNAANKLKALFGRDYNEIQEMVAKNDKYLNEATSILFDPDAGNLFMKKYIIASKEGKKSLIKDAFLRPAKFSAVVTNNNQGN